MHFTEKDFSSCIFNPATKDLFGRYPELENLFVGMPADEKVMKYVICMYDPNSPIVRRNPDLDDRKEAAADYADLDLTEDDEIFTFASDNEDNPFLTLVSTFLKKYAFPLVWVGIIADEQTFYEYSARLMRPIKDILKDKDDVAATVLKSKLSADKEEIRLRIEAGYTTLFGNNDHLKKHNKKKTSPESKSNSV